MTPACRWRAGSRARRARQRRRHARGAAACGGTCARTAAGRDRTRRHRRRQRARRRPDRHQPRRRPPPAGGRRGASGAARRSSATSNCSRRRCRSSQAKPRGDCDHRHQRQKHGDAMAGDICAPPDDGPWSPATSARRCSMRWARSSAGGASPDVFVLELSSFQLETTASLNADAAAMLNLSEDHLDRYDGIDDYARAKQRIFNGDGVQVLNRDDARSAAMAQPGRIVHRFGTDAPHGEREWGIAGRRRRTRAARAITPRCCRWPTCRSPVCTTRPTRWPPARLCHAIGLTTRRSQSLARVQGAAASRRENRGDRRCHLLRRLEGHQRRRDRGGARRLCPAGGADRRRRRQGPGFRAAARAGGSDARARWC